jgi:hypothetical protein
MNQREKISNTFSDAYLLALLEGKNAQDILTQFSKEFSELAPEFEANAHSLDLLYGGFGSDGKPNENEIRTAYKKVSERLDSRIPAHIVPPVRAGFFSGLKTLFSASPMWAGATLGIGVAVIIAVLWQPWVIRESMKEAERNGENKEQITPSGSKEFAVKETPTGVTGMPEVQYRGKKVNQKLTAVQQNQQDSIDQARMKMGEPKPLLAPNGLRAESDGSGAIKLSWDPAPSALSYIVELRGENDANFDPVTQIAQVRARITHLESRKKYYIRIIAASGERVSLPSEVKSIAIP